MMKRIRFTNAELYVICAALDAELPSPLAASESDLNPTEWEVGVRSLIARCLLQPASDGGLTLDAEYGGMVARALAAPGMLSIVSQPNDDESLISILLVSDEVAFAVHPIVEGVWEFLETSLESAAETACQIAAELGPSSLGFMADTSADTEAVRIRLEAAADGFDFDGEVVSNEAAEQRVLELLTLG